MNKLTKEQILSMHSELIAEYGGSDGLQDNDLFESALATPYHTFDGHDLFPTVHEKAARLGFGLVMNHPFVDGNKRIGAHAMLVMLEMNAIQLEYTQDELCEVFIKVASGIELFEGLFQWVLSHEVL